MKNDDMSNLMVKRKTEGHLNDENDLQENLVYEGDSNPFIFNNSYDLTLRCNFEFSNYPFDHQICKIQVRYAK